MGREHLYDKHNQNPIFRAIINRGREKGEIERERSYLKSDPMNAG